MKVGISSRRGVLATVSSGQVGKFEPPSWKSGGLQDVKQIVESQPRVGIVQNEVIRHPSIGHSQRQAGDIFDALGVEEEHRGVTERV